MTIDETANTLKESLVKLVGFSFCFFNKREITILFLNKFFLNDY